MDRIKFNSVFLKDNGGNIEPVRTVRIGGVQMSPGVKFGRGVSFGGVNLFDYIGRDFRTEEQNGILIITGIY
jgi:hypothetical protein